MHAKVAWEMYLRSGRALSKSLQYVYVMLDKVFREHARHAIHYNIRRTTWSSTTKL